MSQTILWHDYETWGTNPQLDFPAQFAAIRTDLNLEVIGKPSNFFCQIPNDYLPHPEACLVTGITPQLSLQKGYIEMQFAQKIYQEMTVPNTCVAGYNSLKFDDEVTRHLLYRNFYPVYDREYAQGNSRWDIIDLVRAAYALRPEGIEWCYYDDGKPCFKLDQLSVANNITHANAHDALSDVYATIGMAKIIKEVQPKLYDYYWQCRDKHQVASHINLGSFKSLVYISGFTSANQGCCSIILPIAQHPSNQNSVICVDLTKPIDGLLPCNAEQLQDLLYNSQSNNRPGVNLVKINQCPFVAPMNVLSSTRAEELGIDLSLCESRRQQLVNNPQVMEFLMSFFANKDYTSEDSNVDAMLYSRGFPSPADKLWMMKVRQADPMELGALSAQTDSSLNKRQLFKYQGRNFPSSFDDQMQQQWQHYRVDRLQNGDGCLSLQAYGERIYELAQQNSSNERHLAILKQLENYLATI
ncbi:exodeoxyribonuclease I [Glaciecola sp. 1036]|uniref:exodeoxyribonuclease I n=1 Tax=Alteromonadaceae TaxID=72275 RepID=UPI003D06F1FD